MRKVESLDITFMDANELSRLKEFVGSDFLNRASNLLPKDKSKKEFYTGYAFAMIDSMRLVKQFSDVGIINNQQLEVLTEAFGAFYIRAEEQQ